MANNDNLQSSPSAAGVAIARLGELRARVDELETRTAFQDDLLSTLNDVIARQDQEITQLKGQMERLREQIKLQGGLAGGGEASGHEPPPHY